MKAMQERQREACESFRILVFGRVGNEDWGVREKNSIFEQRRGTQAEVETFVNHWIQLDADESGDIDFGEFTEYFVKSNADRLLGMRCVRWLISVGCDDGDVCEKRHKKPTTCTKEDMMRLLWLKATNTDIAAMNNMFVLYKFKKKAVSPLPLLPKKKRRELLENFKDLGQHAQDLVPYTALVDADLVDHDLTLELQAKYDKDKNGLFDFEEFLEMLCPYGYRAHEQVKQAVRKDGMGMRYIVWKGGDCHFRGWLLDSDFATLNELYAIE